MAEVETLEPVSRTNDANQDASASDEEPALRKINTDTLDESINLGAVYKRLAERYPHTFGPEGTTPILHWIGEESGGSKYGIDDNAVRKWALQQLEGDNSENHNNTSGRLTKLSKVLRRRLTSPKNTSGTVQDVNLNQFVKFDNEQGLVLDKDELARYRIQRSRNGEPISDTAKKLWHGIKDANRTWEKIRSGEVSYEKVVRRIKRLPGRITRPSRKFDK